MIELKALSALLSYPTEELRQALPDIAVVMRSSRLLAERERAALVRLAEELAAGDLLSAEERYVALFDRSRAASLHLFEHLYGDSRDRGSALTDLKRLYARAGFSLTTRELPDYLPVVLEYLSCRDLAEARDMLADCSHILRRIAETLISHSSSYATVLQALIVIAGEQPVDVSAVPNSPGRGENLDRDWLEEPAFAEVSLMASRAGEQS